MKRTTDGHPKLLELMDRLGLRRWEAFGLLECLWHFTAKFTPIGNIGKFSDETIARSLDWDRTSPADLISALVDVGWLDPCEPGFVEEDSEEQSGRALRDFSSSRWRVIR